MLDDRYSRQRLFAPIGEAGQARLNDARVVIIGCGALGAMQAETLARAGVGHLTLVDRDFVEESNLQRQIMFEESDARERLPKAIAAARRIRRVNSDIHAEPVVADVNFENVEEVIATADLVLDGTDNFETRYLINDACVKAGMPWIYGAAVGAYGLTMTVIPGQTPCLRCVLEMMPEPGAGPTCDTAGVILPIIAVIASIQSVEAIKLLTGQRDQLHGSLIRVDVWDFAVNRLSLSNVDERGDCPACGKREFEFLKGAGRQVTTTLCGRNAVQIGRSGASRLDFARLAERLKGAGRQVTTTLCGRNAVQIGRSGASRLDFARLAERLKGAGEVAYNDFLLRFRVDSYDITVFRDARSIIRGTQDPAIARGLYARYIGT